jgi:hypothetical protein
VHLAFASDDGACVTAVAAADGSCVAVARLPGGTVADAVRWGDATQLLLGVRHEEAHPEGDGAEPTEAVGLWVMEIGEAAALGDAALYQLSAVWNGGGSLAADCEALDGPLVFAAFVRAWRLAVVAHRWLNDDQVGPYIRLA